MRGPCLLLSLSLLSMACQEERSRPGQPFPGRELVVQGRYEEAVEVLRQDLEDDPRGPHASRAWLFLGKAYLALDRLGEAETAFRSCIRELPDSLEAHKCRYKLALISLVRGDREAAREQFEALTRQPDGPLAAEAAALVRHLSQ